MPGTSMDGYVGLMEEIKPRLGMVGDILSEDHDAPLWYRVETAALQLRMALEATALASLSAHRSAYARAHQDFAREWNAGRILDRLERIHPDFYPRPQLAAFSTLPNIRIELSGRHDDYLARSEFPRAYGRVGALVHLPNPFGAPRDHEAARSALIDLRDRLTRLLDWHMVRLIGEDRLYLVQMTGGDGRATWTQLERFDDLPE